MAAYTYVRKHHITGWDPEDREAWDNGGAQIAKRNAGDLSVKLIGFANLTDAVMEEHKIQKSRDPTAVYSLKS